MVCRLSVLSLFYARRKEEKKKLGSLGSLVIETPEQDTGWHSTKTPEYQN